MYCECCGNPTVHLWNKPVIEGWPDKDYVRLCYTCFERVTAVQVWRDFSEQRKPTGISFTFRWKEYA